MKKSNAIITWIFITFLMMHVVITCLETFGIFFSKTLINVFTRGTMAAFAVHAILSIVILVTSNEAKGPIKYKKDNAETMVQRLTGILMILLIVPHILVSKLFTMAGPIPAINKVLSCIVEFLFFYGVFDHISASFTKTLITLGLVRSEQKRRKIDIAVKFTAMSIMVITIVIIFIGIIRFTGLAI